MVSYHTFQLEKDGGGSILVRHRGVLAGVRSVVTPGTAFHHHPCLSCCLYGLQEARLCSSRFPLSGNIGSPSISSRPLLQSLVGGECERGGHIQEAGLDYLSLNCVWFL